VAAMSGPASYQVRRLSEMEHAFGGALARVRAELGISAFGVQVPPAVRPAHVHNRKPSSEDAAAKRTRRF
jgi:hypothetical protein